MTRKYVRGLAIPNTCVKFRQNRSKNKVARAVKEIFLIDIAHNVIALSTLTELDCIC
jgi:hypothetical protein